MSDDQDRDIAEVIALIDKAHDKVVALCHGENWTMHIPADSRNDPDLVIGEALREARKAISRLSQAPAHDAGDENALRDALAKEHHDFVAFTTDPFVVGDGQDEALWAEHRHVNPDCPICALLALSQGQGENGSYERPFTLSFNSRCLKRHDSDLTVVICERDDAFELVVIPPGEGPQRHYRINADGSWTDQSQPPAKPEPRGDALEILEAVANYQVQEYAGANYSCLFCGGVDGTHETDCISLKAAALLASSQPQPDGLRAMVTVDFVDAIESIATRYRDSGQCTFYATVTELLDLLPAIRATLAQPQPDGLKPEPRGDAHGDIKHMALDIIDCIKLAGEMWDKHAGNPAGTALASDKLRFAVEYVNSLAHDAALLASSQGQGDEEAACLQLIAERDNAEEMVDDLLDLVGVEHEWSNLYNYNDALTDAKNKLAHPQPDESQGQGDEPWLALVDLYGLVTDYATIPDEEYHKITNAADLIQSNIGTLRTTHPQPDESQGQGELPEVKHLDGAFCDLVVTYSQAEFLLSKATGRKITLGHYIHPQPDEGLREALEAIDAYGKSPVDGRDEVLWFADILKIARAALAKGEGE